MHSCLDDGYPVRLAFIPYHRTPGSMPVDGATGSKSSTCSKCGMSVLKFSRCSYLDSHLSESIHAWTKGSLSLHNIGPLGPCPGGSRGQKLVNLQNVVFLRLNVSRSPYLDKHLSKSIQTWTIGTLKGWISFHNIGSQGPCLGLGWRTTF